MLPRGGSALSGALLRSQVSQQPKFGTNPPPKKNVLSFMPRSSARQFVYFHADFCVPTGMGIREGQAKQASATLLIRRVEDDWGLLEWVGVGAVESSRVMDRWSQTPSTRLINPSTSLNSHARLKLRDFIPNTPVWVIAWSNVLIRRKRLRNGTRLAALILPSHCLSLPRVPVPIKIHCNDDWLTWKRLGPVAFRRCSLLGGDTHTHYLTPSANLGLCEQAPPHFRTTTDCRRMLCLCGNHTHPLECDGGFRCLSAGKLGYSPQPRPFH